MSFIDIISIQPIVILIGILPITVSGVGTREGLMILLYGGLAPKATILSVALAYSVLSVIVLPIIGLPFMYILLKNKLKK